jgi:hypothetical protein
MIPLTVHCQPQVFYSTGYEAHLHLILDSIAATMLASLVLSRLDNRGGRGYLDQEKNGD